MSRKLLERTLLEITGYVVIDSQVNTLIFIIAITAGISCGDATCSSRQQCCQGCEDEGQWCASICPEILCGPPTEGKLVQDRDLKFYNLFYFTRIQSLITYINMMFQ